MKTGRPRLARAKAVRRTITLTVTLDRTLERFARRDDLSVSELLRVAALDMIAARLEREKFEATLEGEDTWCQECEQYHPLGADHLYWKKGT